METLSGSRGRILIAGFWGISRHDINYGDEIFQAIALASIGGAVKPVLSHCKARLAPLF